MTRSIGLILLISIIFLGCSEQSSEQNKDVVVSENTSPSLTNGDEQGASVVCGVMYKINDFDLWLEEYKNIALGTIIILRNVDDPSLVVVFEGWESLELAEKRSSELISDAFLNNAGIEDNPIGTIHKIQYYQPPSTEFKQHVALNFNSPDIKLLISRLQRDSDLFAQYGLTVMGIGNNVDKAEEVYVLLTLEDFVSFRQNTNSPREIRRFIEKLNLPSETFISDWTKTSL